MAKVAAYRDRVDRIALALVYSDGRPANDTFPMTTAIRKGERLERDRIIRWLSDLENDDAYEYGSPGALAEKILRNVHRKEGA